LAWLGPAAHRRAEAVRRGVGEFDGFSFVAERVQGRHLLDGEGNKKEREKGTVLKRRRDKVRN
jgi:hypothetical protein